MVIKSSNSFRVELGVRFGGYVHFYTGYNALDLGSTSG